MPHPPNQHEKCAMHRPVLWHLWAEELRSINRDRMLAQDAEDWPENELEH